MGLKDDRRAAVRHSLARSKIMKPTIKRTKKAARKRVRLGTALVAIGRKMGLTADEFATMEKVRDKTPAKPIRTVWDDL
jgi:hypothetical protein